MINMFIFLAVVMVSELYNVSKPIDLCTLNMYSLLHASSVQFSSGQFSRSVVSDSLRPHESQHARPPCPSPTPGVHSDYVH